MIVRYSESVELDPELRFAIFALAGKLEVYQRGMRMRDCVKALMAKCGTSWVDQLDITYPAGMFNPPKRRKQRKPKAEVAHA